MKKKELTQTSIPLERYSEEDLQEFEIIINAKFEKAQLEIDKLERIINKAEKHDISDLEESRDSYKEQRINLNKALDRIKDGSYGVCAVTGKLIDKKILEENPLVTVAPEVKVDVAKPKENFLRKYNGYVFYEGGLYEKTGLTQLFIYPDIALVDTTPLIPVHTIYFEINNAASINQNIEAAKQWVNALKRCRVCQCTEHNCRQCIEKTGEPCTWIEDDLCSACVEIKEPTTSVTSTDQPEVLTNFFQQLSAAGYKDCTIRVYDKNGKLTINFIPGAVSIGFPPILLTDSPEQIDKDFFNGFAEKIKNAIASFVEPEKTEISEDLQPNEVAKHFKQKRSNSKSVKKTLSKKIAKKPIAKKTPVVKKAIKKPVQKHKGVEKKQAAKRLPPVDLFAGVPDKD